jgi:hypothetical protein
VGRIKASIPRPAGRIDGRVGFQRRSAFEQ